MSSRKHKPYNVSLILIAYNQEQFVRQACESVLHQHGGSIEIILSDDCSIDGTYKVMQDVVSSYRGHHRVILRRNEHNLGLVGHINKVIGLCSGEFIVYAAGDDISAPERVVRTMDLFANGDGKVLICSSHDLT